MYLTSSVFSVLEYEAWAREREAGGLPPLLLFSTDFYALDWFGWGDWLYLLTSVAAFFEPIVEYRFASSPSVGWFYFITSLLFLIDSLTYFIGYQVFIRDVQVALSGYKLVVPPLLHTEGERERDGIKGSELDNGANNRFIEGIKGDQSLRQKIAEFRRRNAEDETHSVPATKATSTAESIARRVELSFNGAKRHPVKSKAEAEIQTPLLDTCSFENL